MGNARALSKRSVMSTAGGHCASRCWLRAGGGALFPQAVAGEIEAVGVVDEAVEDGVGVGGIADETMPLIDGDLAALIPGLMNFLNLLRDLVAHRL